LVLTFVGANLTRQIDSVHPLSFRKLGSMVEFAGRDPVLTDLTRYLSSRDVKGLTRGLDVDGENRSQRPDMLGPPLRAKATCIVSRNLTTTMGHGHVMRALAFSYAYS
jgi:hypothetical protein